MVTIISINNKKTNCPNCRRQIYLETRRYIKEKFPKYC